MYLIMGIGETEYVLAFPASPSQPQGSTVTRVACIPQILSPGSYSCTSLRNLCVGAAGCVSLCTHVLSPFKCELCYSWLSPPCPFPRQAFTTPPTFAHPMNKLPAWVCCSWWLILTTAKLQQVKL